MTPAERFWSHVAKSDGCWLWVGATYANGYGRIRVGARCVVAHRQAWILTNGAIPDGLLACHKCDNRPCVRPDHLFLGSHADNVRDMDIKGRRADFRGESHPGARLTSDDVLTIRARHASGDAQNIIASEYGVTAQTVCFIVNRQTWRHV